MAAPTLNGLKERQCTPAELQEALVQLIELHNQLDAKITRMVKNGQIRSAKEASLSRRYGI